MDSHAAAQTYREATFENAPPVKILRMLYHGAIRFIDQAKVEGQTLPNPKFNELTSKVDAIVTELRLALDPEHNPEVCANLEQLYLFCGQRLNDARINNTIEPLDDVRGVLETLNDAWSKAEVPPAAGQDE